jgi:hypothetical protein
MPSRFLFNDTLWDELGRRVAKAKNVAAAVAYLGSGASDLLPLRRGHRLVVDMSLRAVRAGSTDPKEVRKLLRRGVHVFTRASLHAKFLVIDRVVMAGSANISKRARTVHDEAAILTADPAAVARASTTFERLCTEPIRKEYLAKCIAEYRPPKGSPATRGGKHGPGRLEPAKLWVIGGLRYQDLPENEHVLADRIRRKVAKLLSYERTEVDDIHFPTRPRFFDAIREDDWCITCIRDGQSFDVWPPARVIRKDTYPRGDGRRRYLLLFEVPSGRKPVSWRKVRTSIRATIRALDRPKPRTTAVQDDDQADALLRLWDSRGKFRK